MSSAKLGVALSYLTTKRNRVDQRGVGGGIRTFRKPDGTSGREYLDVGENPPNGAILHYWLDEGISGPVALAFYDDFGRGDRELPQRRQ
jgi:hypothetical protein